MKEKLSMILNILLGNALIAFAVCAFVIPNGIMLGGSNGIALTVQHWLPLRMSVITAVANIILFALGFVCLGWKFAATSLVSTIVYPIIMGVLEVLPLGELFRQDILVASIFTGVMVGMGVGLVVRSGGSTGGMDIPPCILRKFFGIPVGTSLMFLDLAVVLMQVSFRGLDGILYSIITIVLTSLVLDYTIVSGERKVEIIIISPKNEQIRQEILKSLDCGVTMLHIETGYEGKEQQAILSVVYNRKYPEIRDAALRIDSSAFIVANDVRNVNGRGYTLARSGDINK